MRKILVIAMILVGTAVVSGCSSKSLVGGVVGAGAAAGGYEVHLKRQMDRIDKDLANGTISQEEFEIRKNQIERDSLVR